MGMQTSSGAHLEVTSTHRVAVPDGETEASVLREGDKVLCNHGECDLTQVIVYSATVEIVQLLLQPDEPIESFHPPQHTILTKGSMSRLSADTSREQASGKLPDQEQKKKSHRGGRHRHSRKQKKDD